MNTPRTCPYCDSSPWYTIGEVTQFDCKTVALTNGKTIRQDALCRSRVEITRLRTVVKGALDELINLQPHIPQSCYPGHEKFIDTHVDAAIKLLSTGTTE